MRQSLLKQLGLLLCLAAVAVILWVDIATGLWQEYVILAGLAAGLVTFMLTALVIDKVMERSAHKRWVPVTHLALTDLLHALADEEASEITRGTIVPRTLRFTAMGSEPKAVEAALEDLRHTVVTERRILTKTLASWASFLASSADATEIIDHAADLGERLDLVRDATIEASASLTNANLTAAKLDLLNLEIDRYNTALQQLIDELHRVIGSTRTLPAAAQEQQA